MNGLFAPLAAYAANEVRGRVRRQAKVAIGYAVAGLSALGLVIVALVSMHRFLGMRWGPYWADAAIAGLLVVVAAAGLLYASRQAEAPAVKAADAPNVAMSAAAATAAPVALSLLKRGGGVGVLGVLAAVAIGVLAGKAASQD